QFVWIGRRPSDDSIEARLDTMAALGPRPLYIAADATVREQLEDARRQILRRFGRIDAVVHAAMVLRDRTLPNMTLEEFETGLRAKVDVCVRLAQVFRNDR